MENRKETVLVTGGAGFIGSHVAGHLLKMGCLVVGLDDLSGGYAENVPAGVRFVEGSILDEALLNRLFEEFHFSIVFHLAAYAAEGLSHFVRSFNYLNNVVGSMNLISRSIKYRCRKFIFTSSIAVYGTNQLPMGEYLVPRPEDPYGIAKYAVEQDLAAMHEFFGLDYVIFRPHNVYGEAQNAGDHFRNVIGIFMRQILKGEKLTVFGDGTQTRSFTYIDDVAPVIAQSAWEEKAANQIFNIGADKPYSINELIERVSKAMGAQPEIVYLPARREVLHAYASHDKVKKVFGHRDRASVSLEEGLRRMAAWIKKTGVRESRKLPVAEVWERLPSHWAKALTEAGQLRFSPSVARSLDNTVY